MGRRNSRDFQRFSEHKHLDLDDGDVLRWMVVDRPERDPFVAYFRSDRHGALHGSKGTALLEAAGHPDATLSWIGDRPSRPLIGPPPMTG